MPDIQYVALLRGINVGGKNVIRMNELKSYFENMGFSSVVTYIQSGNVLFRSPVTDKSRLEKKIEKELSEHFSAEIRLVLVTQEELREIVEEAPGGFGTEPESYRYDVLFLKEPHLSAETVKTLKMKEGVDNAWAGSGVLYFSRLIIRASQSYLTRIIQLPVYKNITIRNWNTVIKLAALTRAGNP